MAWIGLIQQGVNNQQQAAATGASERGNELIARQNATLAREDARRLRTEAGRAEEAHRRVVREELGAAFTAAAQSGARGGGGTTADRQIARSATLAELDALNIRYGGELDAGAKLMDAANYDYEAQAARARAKAADTKLKFGTAGSLLSASANYGATVMQQRTANRPTMQYRAPSARVKGKAPNRTASQSTKAQNPNPTYTSTGRK